MFLLWVHYSFDRHQKYSIRTNFTTKFRNYRARNFPLQCFPLEEET